MQTSTRRSRASMTHAHTPVVLDVVSLLLLLLLLLLSVRIPHGCDAAPQPLLPSALRWSDGAQESHRPAPLSLSLLRGAWSRAAAATPALTTPHPRRAASALEAEASQPPGHSSSSVAASLPHEWREVLVGAAFQQLLHASSSSNNNNNSNTSLSSSAAQLNRQDATAARTSFLPLTGAAAAQRGARRLRVKGYLLPSPAIFECTHVGQIVASVQSLNHRHACRAEDVITPEVRRYAANQLVPRIEQWIAQHLLRHHEELDLAVEATAATATQQRGAAAHEPLRLEIHRGLGNCEDVIPFIPKSHVAGFGPGPVDTAVRFELNADGTDAVPVALDDPDEASPLSSSQQQQQQHDLVVYITFMLTQYFFEARPCQWHPVTNRPTIIHLNIGGAGFSSTFGFGGASDHVRNVVFHHYILHELMHALALSRFMYDLDPTYFTAPAATRNSTAGTTWVENVALDRGARPWFRRRSRSEVLSSFTRPEGVSGSRMRLPGMRAIAQQRFHCFAPEYSEGLGVDLEQTGDGSLVVDSHVDARTWAFELNAFDLSAMLVTNLTFQILQSTGFYEVDFRHAFVEQNGFGAGAGCGFVTRRCNETWHRVAPQFATVVNSSYIRFDHGGGKLPPHAVAQPTIHATTLAALRGTRFSNASLRQQNFCFSLGQMCSVDHTAIAQCTIQQYTFDLPPTMRYFADTLGANVGGHARSADYCPLPLSLVRYCDASALTADSFCFQEVQQRRVSVEYATGTIDTAGYFEPVANGVRCLQVVNCDAEERAFDVVLQREGGGNSSGSATSSPLPPSHMLLGRCVETPETLGADPLFGHTNTPVFEAAELHGKIFACPKFDVVCGAYLQQHTHLYPLNVFAAQPLSDQHLVQDILTTHFPTLSVGFAADVDSDEAGVAFSQAGQPLSDWLRFHNFTAARPCTADHPTESPQRPATDGAVLRLRRVPFEINFTLPLVGSIRYGALLLARLPRRLRQCDAFRFRSDPPMTRRPVRQLGNLTDETLVSLFGPSEGGTRELRTAFAAVDLSDSSPTAAAAHAEEEHSGFLGFLFDSAETASNASDVFRTPIFYCDFVAVVVSSSSSSAAADDDLFSISPSLSDEERFVSLFGGLSGDPGMYSEVSLHSLFASRSLFNLSSGTYSDNVSALLQHLIAADSPNPTPAALSAAREHLLRTGAGPGTPGAAGAFFSDEVGLRQNFNPPGDDLGHFVSQLAVCLPNRHDDGGGGGESDRSWPNSKVGASVVEVVTEVIPAACRAALAPGGPLFDAHRYISASGDDEGGDAGVVKITLANGSDTGVGTRGGAALRVLLNVSGRPPREELAATGFSIASVSLAADVDYYGVGTTTDPAEVAQALGNVFLPRHIREDYAHRASPASPALRITAAQGFDCFKAENGTRRLVQSSGGGGGGGMVPVSLAVWLLRNTLSNGTLGTPQRPAQSVPFASMLGPTIAVSLLPSGAMDCRALIFTVHGFHFEAAVRPPMVPPSSPNATQPPVNRALWPRAPQLARLSSTVGFSATVWTDHPKRPAVTTASNCFAVSSSGAAPGHFVPLQLTATAQNGLHTSDAQERALRFLPVNPCTDCPTPLYVEVAVPFGTFDAAISLGAGEAHREDQPLANVSAQRRRIRGFTAGDTITVHLPTSDFRHDALMRRALPRVNATVLGCPRGTLAASALWAHQRLLVTLTAASTTSASESEADTEIDGLRATLAANPLSLGGFPEDSSGVFCRPIGGRLGVVLDGDFRTPRQAINLGAFPLVEVRLAGSMRVSRSDEHSDGGGGETREQILRTIDTALVAEGLTPRDATTLRGCTRCNFRGLCREWHVCECFVGFGGPRCDICASEEEGIALANGLLSTASGGVQGGCAFSCDANPPPHFPRAIRLWSGACRRIGGVMDPNNECRCFCNGTLCGMELATPTVTATARLRQPSTPLPTTDTAPDATTAESGQTLAPESTTSSFPPSDDLTPAPTSLPPGTPSGPTHSVTRTSSATETLFFHNIAHYLFVISLDVRGEAIRPPSKLWEYFSEVVAAVVHHSTIWIGRQDEWSFTKKNVVFNATCARSRRECGTLFENMGPVNDDGTLLFFTLHNVPPSSSHVSEAGEPATKSVESTYSLLMSAVANQYGTQRIREDLEERIPMAEGTPIIVVYSAPEQSAWDLTRTRSPSLSPLLPPATPAPLQGAVPVVIEPVVFFPPGGAAGAAAPPPPPPAAATRPVSLDELRSGRVGLRVALNAFPRDDDIVNVMLAPRSDTYAFNLPSAACSEGMLAMMNQTYSDAVIAALSSALLSAERSSLKIARVWCEAALASGETVTALIIQLLPASTPTPLVRASVVPLVALPLPASSRAALAAIISGAEDVALVWRGSGIAARSSGALLREVARHSDVGYYYYYDHHNGTSLEEKLARLVLRVSAPESFSRNVQIASTLHLLSTTFAVLTSYWSSSDALIVALIGFAAPRCSCLPSGSETDFFAATMSGGLMDSMGHAAGMPVSWLAHLIWSSGYSMRGTGGDLREFHGAGGGAHSASPNSTDLPESSAHEADEDERGADATASAVTSAAPFSSILVLWTLTWLFVFPVLCLLVALQVSQKPREWIMSRSPVWLVSAFRFLFAPLSLLRLWVLRLWAPLGWLCATATLVEQQQLPIIALEELTAWKLSRAAAAAMAALTLLLGVIASCGITAWLRKVLPSEISCNSMDGEYIRFDLLFRKLQGDVHVTAAQEGGLGEDDNGVADDSNSLEAHITAVVDPGLSHAAAVGPRRQTQVQHWQRSQCCGGGAERARAMRCFLAAWPRWLMPSGCWIVKRYDAVGAVAFPHKPRHMLAAIVVGDVLKVLLVAALLGASGGSNRCEAGAGEVRFLSTSLEERLSCGDLFIVLIVLFGCLCVFDVATQRFNSPLQIAQSVAMQLGLAALFLLRLQAASSSTAAPRSSDGASLFRTLETDNTVADGGGSSHEYRIAEVFPLVLMAFDVVVLLLFPILCMIERWAVKYVWQPLELSFIDVRDQRHHLEMRLLCPDDDDGDDGGGAFVNELLSWNRRENDPNRPSERLSEQRPRIGCPSLVPPSLCNASVTRGGEQPEPSWRRGLPVAEGAVGEVGAATATVVQAPSFNAPDEDLEGVVGDRRNPVRPAEPRTHRACAVGDAHEAAAASSRPSVAPSLSIATANEHEADNDDDDNFWGVAVPPKN